MFKKFFIIKLLLVLVLLLMDFFVDKSKVHFNIERFFAFFAIIGFSSSFIYILFSKYVLRKIVSRDGEYYDK